MNGWNSARDPGFGMAYFNRTDLPFYYALAGTCTHLLWHLWHLSFVVAPTAWSSLLCGAQGYNPTSYAHFTLVVSLEMTDVPTAPRPRPLSHVVPLPPSPHNHHHRRCHHLPYLLHAVQTPVHLVVTPHTASFHGVCRPEQPQLNIHTAPLRAFVFFFVFFFFF